MHGPTASPKCKIRKMSPSLKSETVLIWFAKKSPRLDHEDLPSSIFLRFLFFSKCSLFCFLFFFSFLYSWLTQKSLPKIKNICRRVYKYQMRWKNVRNTIATMARAPSFAWKLALVPAPKERPTRCDRALGWGSGTRAHRPAKIQNPKSQLSLAHVMRNSIATTAFTATSVAGTRVALHL